MIDLIEEAKRVARMVARQSYLVRQEAELIEAALFEDQDDPNVHHVRPGQATPLILDWSTGQRATFDDNVIPFKRRHK